LATIAIQVTVLAAKFATLVARGRVVSVILIATQFLSIVSNLGPIVLHIPTRTIVSIPSESRHGTQSSQQQDSSDCAFHICHLRTLSGVC
jgi:hypothetical protein